MSRKNVLLKIVLPLLILGLGMAGMWFLVQHRQAPAKQPHPFQGVLVETTAVARGGYPLVVSATGTVQARQQAEIVPQVSGEIVEMAAQLRAGGFFRSGELLFAVESIDYQLAQERAAASLSRAELDLETIKARARIASEEWRHLHPDEEPEPLVVYQPQLKSAAAAVASARAALDQARLDLDRTRLRAPFNCYVRSESVAEGQFVRAGTTVAVVVGTDRAEVIVPITMEDLGWLKVPRRGEGKGSAARVALQVGAREFEWDGYIERSLAEVDPQGRMARIAVVVEDPFRLRPAGDDQPELAVGSFVRVALHGELVPDVVTVPRKALREGDRVWVAGADRKLRIVPVEVVRREREVVLVGAGLAGDERLVLTPVSGAADGLLLRFAEN